MQTIQCQSKLTNKIEQYSKLSQLFIILAGSLALAISAQITIPIQPVPVTLQSFAALLIGMMFGPKTSIKIIAAYLIEGACGLPVFANLHFGLVVLFGPRGGYLFGFMPAAALSGYLLQRGFAKHFLTIFLAALLGTITLFIFGYLVLAFYFGYRNAFEFGVMPFYFTESCKLIIFTVITPFFWRHI